MGANGCLYSKTNNLDLNLNLKCCHFLYITIKKLNNAEVTTRKQLRLCTMVENK